MQTQGYDFDQHPGIEKFRIVWAAHAIAELEEIKAIVLNTKDKGSITNARQRDTVRALLSSLNGSKAEVSEDRVRLQTVVKGRGGSLTHLVELNHH